MSPALQNAAEDCFRHNTLHGLQAHIFTASTPQNTPANAAPISSRAQMPGVDSIKEGKFCFSPRRFPLDPAPTVCDLSANSIPTQRIWSVPPPVCSPPTPPLSP